MTLLAISQRHVDAEHPAGALESSYVECFGALGAVVVPIPNLAEAVPRYFDRIAFAGVVLSGGGDVGVADAAGALGERDLAPARDAAEKAMLDLARERGLPVLGICRGMQQLNVLLGGALRRDASSAHDGTRHPVGLLDPALRVAGGQSEVEVNSHHRMVICESDLAPALRPFAIAEDETVEGIYHPDEPLAATIWHPERPPRASRFNDRLVRAFLTRDLFWEAR